MTWRPGAGGRKQRPHSPKLFMRDPVVCFLEVNKTWDVLGIFPRFLENFLESENLVCGATARKKAASSRFGSIISRRLFFKALGIRLSKETKGRDAPVVSAFTPISLLVYGDNHPSLPMFLCPSRTLEHLTHMIQPKNLSVQGFEHSSPISSQTVAFTAFRVLTAGKTSSAVMVFSLKAIPVSPMVWQWLVSKYPWTTLSA